MVDPRNPASEEAEELRYYREIETHWSWRRENQIILSPIEFECMERWFVEGVPLSVVYAAIDEFIEHKRRTPRSRHFLLNHVEDLVGKLFEQYRSLHVGEGAGAGGIDVAQRLDALAGRVHRVLQRFPGHRSIIEATAQAIEAIRPEDVVSLEELEGHLIRIDEAFVRGFMCILAPEDREALESEVSSFVDREEDPDLFARLFDDVVRVHFQIPRLTVLG